MDRVLLVLAALAAVCSAVSPPVFRHSCRYRCDQSSYYDVCSCASSCGKPYPPQHCCGDYQDYCVQAKDCNPPDYVPNSSYKPRKTKYADGDVVTYECNSGYLIDTDTRKCDDGEWTSAPNCRPPVFAYCPAPPTNPHTSYTPSGHTFYFVRSFVTYSCPNTYGWRLVGKKKLTCIAHNTWDYPAPTCEKISCPDRDPPPYGFHNPSSESPYRHGDWIDYGCVVGYELSGASSAHCQSDGTWNNYVPDCVPVTCPHRPAPSNGYLKPKNKTTWYYKDKVTYKCHPGYKLYGSPNSTCQYNGTWDNDVPECRPVKCPHRSAPFKGFYEPVGQTTWNYKDVVTYRCVYGYALYGSATSTCQYDGTWDNDVPKCRRITCEHRDPPIYVSQSPPGKTVWYVNDVATYSCGEYYDVSGKVTSTCRKDGTWSNGVPTCIYKSCANRCWYEVDARQPCQCISYCNSNKYNCCPDAHLCDVNDDVPHCPTPKAPKYGGVTSHSSYPPNTKVTYSCRWPYILKGQKVTTCLGPNWDHPAPTCIKKPDKNSSCAGRCGRVAQGHETCDCDSDCINYGSCCSDHHAECGH